jgi:CheY-like chemotaxis protein
MRILLVEDEQALRDTTAAALALCGHAVVSTGDGVEALERVCETIPDLVVLDLQMPEMDGWEFLRHFRSIPGCATCPVVVMSAAHRVVVDDLGVQAFFEKPFDLDEMLDVIDQLLSVPVPVHDDGPRARTRNVRPYAEE